MEAALLVRLALFGIGIVAAIKVLKIIAAFLMKYRFMKKYDVKRLSKWVKVKHRRNKRERNHYKLRYPCWEVANADGTRDKRIKNNEIIWKESVLYLDDLVITTVFPDEMVWIVKQLRKNGVQIDLCKEERMKYRENYKKWELFSCKLEIQNVIDTYSEKPTEFEKLCAAIFESMGYTAMVTPPTNDGGYDIMLINEMGRGIVECKCYAINNMIGRPAIQKLVGANTIAKADKMFFVTTSDFSVAASVYANEAGVELINGKVLLQMMSQYGYIENSETNEYDYQLEKDDLRKYIPRDIRI